MGWGHEPPARDGAKRLPHLAVEMTRPEGPRAPSRHMGATVITTDFDVGVWLSSATLSRGTSTFASGK